MLDLNKPTRGDYMKKIKYSIYIFVGLLTLVFGSSISAKAAANVSVVGGKSIQEGSKITITVVATMEDLQALGGKLTYDGNILQYLSTTAETPNPSVGIISFFESRISNAKISVSFTFQAIRTGSTRISAGCSVANSTGLELLADGATTVTVTAPGNTPPGTTPPGSNLSKDAKLASLIVSPGALAPAFDSSIYDYKMQVEAGTTEVAISAKAANAKAVVSSVNGSTGLVKGPNTVTVVVKAESGTTATYTIQVQVGLYPEQVVIEAQVGDLKLKVKNDLTGVVLPDGAVVAPLEIAGETIQGISYNNGMFTLVQLVDEQGVAAFYIYNPDGPTYTLFQEVKIPSSQYVITALDKSYKIPKGYKKVLINIGEYQNVEALVLDKPKVKTNTKVKKIEAVVEDRYFLFQAKNMAGELNWYQYDAKGGTVQICEEPTAALALAQLAPEIDSSGKDNNDNKIKPIVSSTLIIILLSVLCVGLAIPLVALIITQPKNNEE